MYLVLPTSCSVAVYGLDVCLHKNSVGRKFSVDTIGADPCARLFSSTSLGQSRVGAPLDERGGRLQLFCITQPIDKTESTLVQKVK